MSLRTSVSSVYMDKFDSITKISDLETSYTKFVHNERGTVCEVNINCRIHFTSLRIRMVSLDYNLSSIVRICQLFTRFLPK